MTTTPRSPTSTRRATAWLARAAALLAFGVVAYYGLELADRVLMERLTNDPAVGTIEMVELPPDVAPAQVPRRFASTDGPGNPLLRRAAEAIERHGSVSVQLSQHGWIDGQAVEMSGRYHQLGGGSDRQFLFEQTGQLAGAPTRLLRVSDSRRLWTDLAWGDPSNPNRSVTRVDLRRVRRAMVSAEDETSLTAANTDPSMWSRFGGLPMLLEGLDTMFAFGQPRLMELRSERVYAVVGRWRPDRLQRLTNGNPETSSARAPQHVVVALSKQTYFPLLVEYREAGDPLSAPGLPDEALLTSSSRPLLKLDLAAPTFGERLDPRLFLYRPSDENWADHTDRELELVQAREEDNAIARATTSRSL